MMANRATAYDLEKDAKGFFGGGEERQSLFWRKSDAMVRVWRDKRPVLVTKRKVNT
jgi:hypothetical protein